MSEAAPSDDVYTEGAPSVAVRGGDGTKRSTSDSTGEEPSRGAVSSSSRSAVEVEKRRRAEGSEASNAEANGSEDVPELSEPEDWLWDRFCLGGLSLEAIVQ